MTGMGDTGGVPAGWYTDPYLGAGHLRYWDGAAWTEHVAVPEERRYRRLNALAAFVAIAIAATVLMQVAGLLVDLAIAQDQELQDWFFDPDAGYEVLTPQQADLASASWSLILTGTVTFVVAAVLTVVWLWKARANAEVLSPRPHARSRHWVWAGWFVPVVNLWFPFQVVRDVDLASNPRTAFADPDAGASGQVAGWWGCFLATQVLSQVAVAVPGLGMQYVTFRVLEVTASAAAAVLFLLTVRRVTTGQERVAGVVAAGATA